GVAGKGSESDAGPHPERRAPSGIGRGTVWSVRQRERFDLDLERDAHIETEVLAEVDAEVGSIDLRHGVGAADLAALLRVRLALEAPDVETDGLGLAVQRQRSVDRRR